MIVSFNDAETEKVWNGEFSKRLPHDIQRVALRKLVMMHRSINIADLKIPPGNRLEQLRSDREGQWAIRINDQWRVCFKWDNGNAFDVEIVDYH